MKLIGAVALVACLNFAAADDWPRFRGPNGSAVNDAQPLPTEWSTTKSIRWKTAIPGEGFSSPVIWKNRIFLTASFDHGDRRATHCLDRTTGRILWTKEIVEKNPERTSAMTGHAAATPATDGEYVVSFFGNAGVVCYDPDGKQLWHRALGAFDTELGLASSAVIHGDKVILTCDHDGDRFKSFDSFLIALDVQTGATKWKTDRQDVERSWSTPMLIPHGGGQLLIVCGSDHLRAYDPNSGKEMWKTEGLSGWVAPAPVFAGGLIFVTSGKNGPTMAVRVKNDGQPETVWKHDRGGAYVCSPVVYRAHVYVQHETGVLSCFEMRSGKLIYKERLDGKFTSSPFAGDGKVFTTNEDGTTYVLAAGAKFEILARNKLDEYTLASPAVADGVIYLRTEKHLFCIRR